MVFPIAAAISAGSSLLGGILGQRSQAKMAEQNIEMQKLFAKKGIQWKVKDSLAAGVHPLFGLGAQTTSFSPVSVGDSIGPAMADAGQDISRAISATSDPAAKVSATMAGLQVERAGLENELLRSQIRGLNSPGTMAGLPSVSGDNSDPLRIAGVSVAANPGWSDAQDIETRYGELGDWLYGLPVMAADAVHNLKVSPAVQAKQQSRFNGLADAIVRRLGWR